MSSLVILGVALVAAAIGCPVVLASRVRAARQRHGVDERRLWEAVGRDLREVPELTPTVSHYISEEHGDYLVWLARAVYGDDKCCNVALAGPYGSGKSSIIDKFCEIYGDRVVRVSLSKFFEGVAGIGGARPSGGAGPSFPESRGLLGGTAGGRGDEDARPGVGGPAVDVPAAGTKPAPAGMGDESPAATANGSGAAATTVGSTADVSVAAQGNGYEKGDPLPLLLEREVVRQLLYQGESTRLPQSRFNQIHQIRLARRFLQSVVASVVAVALLLMVVFVADSGENRLDRWRGAISQNPVVSAATLATVLLFFGAVAWFALPYLRGKMRINQLSVIGAELGLNDGSGIYFDRYLDEIVYFFERNPEVDTVVFEDLDRFGDPRIFEALRELNTILNHAPGVRGARERWARPRDGFGGIHFVYALRDGVFDMAEPEGGFETRGSRRAKFFDVIIPVIPFVSNLSSVDQALRVFAGDIESNREIEEAVRVVAPFLNDMRLLVSAHNEYLVMREKLLTIEKVKALGLKPASMVGMAAYKVVCPADYERIRLGRSELGRIADDPADIGCGREGFAAELVREGIIGSDYELYAAIWPQSARGKAIDFYLHHYRERRPNPSFRLTDDDCRELLKMPERLDFARDSCLNAFLYAYLVRRGRDISAGKMLHNATRSKRAAARAFLKALGDLEQPRTDSRLWQRTAEMLAGDSRAFSYLLRDDSLDDDGKRAVVGLLIQRACDLEYEAEGCEEWLRDNLLKLPAAGGGISDDAAGGISKLARACGAEADNLSLLNARLAEDLVGFGLFGVSRENLKYVSGGDGVLSLDAMRACNEAAYSRIVRDAPSIWAYLDLLGDGELALGSDDVGVKADVLPLLQNTSQMSILHEMCGENTKTRDVTELRNALSDKGVDEKTTTKIIESLAESGQVKASLYNIYSLYSDSRDAGHGVFAHMANAFDARLDPGEGEWIDSDQVSGLCLAVLGDGRIDEGKCRSLLRQSAKRAPRAFPLLVDVLEPGIRSAAFLAKALEDGLVGGPYEVYRLMGDDARDWPSRERCLKRLGSDRLPLNTPLYGGDVARVMMSRKLADTYIGHEVRERPVFWLEDAKPSIEDMEALREAIIRSGYRPSPGLEAMMERKRHADGEGCGGEDV